MLCRENPGYFQAYEDGHGPGQDIMGGPPLSRGLSSRRRSSVHGGPSLSVGFSMSHDPGAWWTLNLLMALYSEIIDEFIIVDNSPDGSEISGEFEGHVRKNHPEARYIRDKGPPSSCLYKDRIFREATSDVVVCMDAHVFLDPGALPAVIRYFTEHPESRDLLMGPICSAASKVVATNQMLYESEGYPIPRDARVRHGIVCRGGQLGVWVTDSRGLDTGGEPFEIQQNGTGFFAMRREAWPGFHPSFYGFGGNETYLMERVRQNGGKVLCHPACRWTHNFCDAHGRGYKPLALDKVRNYLVSGRLLGRDDHYRAALEHFGGIYPEATKEAVRAADEISGSDGYSQSLSVWREHGGDSGGAVPKPVFAEIAKIPRETRGRTTRTLEFGSGLSTIAFTQRGVDHTAIEHDPLWVKRVLAASPNANVVHAEIKDGWYDWRPPLGALYDFILIDGPPGKIGRRGCLDVVPGILAPGGTVVVDDTHRPEERQISVELAKMMGLRRRRHEYGKRGYSILTSEASVDRALPGTELVNIFQSMGMPSCQSCLDLAKRMDEWGVEGCRSREGEIIEDILPRARRWWESSSPWMKANAWFKGQSSAIVAGLKSGGSVNGLLRESIRQHVDKALSVAEGKGT